MEHIDRIKSNSDETVDALRLAVKQTAHDIEHQRRAALAAHMARSEQAAIRKRAAGSGKPRAGDSANFSPKHLEEGPEPDWKQEVLEREGQLLIELQQVDEQVSFGATQAERTAALFLASEMREELAQLGRVTRRVHREMDKHKHAVRNAPTVGCVVTGQAGGPSRGAKGPNAATDDTVQQPDTLSNSPAVHKRVLHGRCPAGGIRGSSSRLAAGVPWSAAGVTARLKQQQQQQRFVYGEPPGREVTAGTTVLAHGALPTCHTTTTSFQPAARQPQEAQPAWHERLYPAPTPRPSVYQLGLSDAQLLALEDALAAYRELQASTTHQPQPVGAYALMRAQASSYQAEAPPQLTGMESRRLVTSIKRAVQQGLSGAATVPAPLCHPDPPDVSRMVDEVTWRPGPAKSNTLPHPPGLCSAGDWDGRDPMRQLARTRALPVDHVKLQLRKRREWEAALKELKMHALAVSSAGKA